MILPRPQMKQCQMSSTFRSKSSNEPLTDQHNRSATGTDARAGVLVVKSRCSKRALSKEELKINCKIKIFRCTNRVTWTAQWPNWVSKFATSQFQTKLRLYITLPPQTQRNKFQAPSLRHTFLTSVIERDSPLSIKSNPKSTHNSKVEAENLKKINSFAHSLLTQTILWHILWQIIKIRDWIYRTKARKMRLIRRPFPLQPILMYFTASWFQMREAMRLRRARKCV